MLFEDPASNATPVYTVNQVAPPNLSTSTQPQAPIQSPQLVGVPGGSTAIVPAVHQPRFLWSHALIAAGVLAASGAGTAIFFKKVAIPKLKTWIRKVVAEEKESEKQDEQTSVLAEQTTEAAKAASTAAAVVAKASEELLSSKNEEKKYFEVFMNMMDVQAKEMKSMGDAIRKLESKREHNNYQEKLFEEHIRLSEPVWGTTVRLNAYDEDEYAKEFGININNTLTSVEARILPTPWLKYHDTGKERNCLPKVGQWNMMNKKMVNGGIITNWACINFSRNIQSGFATRFCTELAHMCQISGMQFAPQPLLPVSFGRPDQVDKALRHQYNEASKILKPQNKELDLLIVLLPDNNGPLYGELKRICETELGIVSQCCLTKNVLKMNKQYLANVALKINVKAGGRNTVLMDAISRKIPLVTDVPTIIFGADVTHPHPGEDSSPSIAAVVASQDWPEVTKNAASVCAQAHRQELIQDLYSEWTDTKGAKHYGGMIRELLISFMNSTGHKPERIIFYRDGVSEGQFYQVLLFELVAIRKACASLWAEYQPYVTFVVVQKRHHTRLFANNHRDLSSVDRSGNILPGTVVDSSICHPTEFDFYLCSHAGIQGTSRPAHYHVLWDDNRFSADALQTLTNNLCYTYARCTRSVSVVPPAYYAHLAAFRARFYMQPDTSDGGSVTSGAAGHGGGPGSAAPAQRAPAAVRPLPALKDNVKRVMFFC